MSQLTLSFRPQFTFQFIPNSSSDSHYHSGLDSRPQFVTAHKPQLRASLVPNSCYYTNPSSGHHSDLNSSPSTSPTHTITAAFSSCHHPCSQLKPQLIAYLIPSSSQLMLSHRSSFMVSLRPQLIAAHRPQVITSLIP